MAKGMPKHTGDPNIQIGGQTFDQMPDGTITVNDILKWISVDADGNPCFVEQNGRLVVRFAFAKLDGTESAPCSTSAAEFWGVVKAFGCDIMGENPVTRHSAEALKRGMKMVNDRPFKNGFTVNVKNGWVNGDRIDQVCPPEGKYTIRFMDAHRLDYAVGDYHFSEYKDKSNGRTRRSLLFDFEIIGNGHGKPTLWDGYKITAWLDDPFTDIAVDTNGRSFQAVQEGRPLYARRSDTGAVAPEVTKWEMFAKYFAPSLAEYEWEIDPSRSKFGVCEVLDPQYVFINVAKSDNRKVVINFKKHPLGKKPNISWGDLPFDNDVPAIDVTEQQAEAERSSTVLMDLVSFIEKTWPAVKIFENSAPGSNELLFTEDGKKWAAEHMGGENGPWVRSGLSLSDRKMLHQLTEDELKKLLVAFKGPLEATEDAEW